jgi:hypothetical protein
MMKMDAHHWVWHHLQENVMLLNAYLVLVQISIYVAAPELSKHLTTSHSPFSDATYNGDLPSLVHKLIPAPELSKHLTTSHFPLRIASLTGKCDVVKCLLSSGADINLCCPLGRSPLFEASLSGHCDVVKCLHGECPSLSHKLISAPGLSKHLTISQCSDNDA